MRLEVSTYTNTVWHLLRVQTSRVRIIKSVRSISKYLRDSKLTLICFACLIMFYLLWRDKICPVPWLELQRMVEWLSDWVSRISFYLFALRYIFSCDDSLQKTHWRYFALFCDYYWLRFVSFQQYCDLWTRAPRNDRDLQGRSSQLLRQRRGLRARLPGISDFDEPEAPSMRRVDHFVAWAVEEKPA